MSGAIHPVPQYAFMAWCLVKKAQGQLYFFFTLYLCTYSLLKGVTFEVLHLSSYALSTTMLPLLETFSNSYLLWNNFQCRHNF